MEEETEGGIKRKEKREKGWKEERRQEVWKRTWGKNGARNG